MITRLLIRDYFHPNVRSSFEFTWFEGMTLQDLEPVNTEGKFMFWREGALVREPEGVLVNDGDIVQVVLVPGLVLEGLHWGYQLLIAAALMAASTIIAKNAAANAQAPNQDPDGSANNGFAGFRNTYEQGGTLPVVYGKHRVAGPNINQEIKATGSPTLVSETETLQVLFAISEGPIYGIGVYRGPVASQADKAQFPLVPVASLDSALGVQINGQPLSNFAGVTIDWRTGETSQVPLFGYEGTTQTFSIEQGLVYLPLATQADFPPGVYASGADIGSLEYSSGDSVSYQLTDPYDRVTVQLLFQKGLFEASTGSPIPSEANFRVEYYATDSGGTRTGDTVVLAEIVVTAAIQSTVVYDFEFALLSAVGYEPVIQTGYHILHGENSQYVSVETPLSVGVLPVGYQDPANLKFSIDTWCRFEQSKTYRNHHIMSHYGGPLPASSTSYPFSPTVSVTSMFGFEFRLVVNVENDPGGGGSTSVTGVYLVCTTWGLGYAGAMQDHFSVALAQGTILSDQWLHVGMTYDASLHPLAPVRFYFNGVDVTPPQGGSLTSDNIPGMATASELFIGRGPVVGAAETRYRTNGAMAEFAFHEGVLDSSYFAAAVGNIENTYGNRLSPIGDNQPGVLAGFAISDFLASPKFENVNFVESTTDGECFESWGTTPMLASPVTSSPIFFPEKGTALKDYYHIEIFRSNVELDDGTVEVNEGTVEQLTLHLDSVSEYPQTALLSARIQADEQVSNQRPLVTALVYGRLCPVWDGLDVDFPTFTEEWTRNPAWIALDMLSNTRYGLGGIFPLPGSYDLPSWKSWADYCDEGVPDGYGEQNFFGGVVAQPFGTNPNGTITVNIPIIDADGAATGFKVPESWAVERTLGILTAESDTNPGQAGAYVTTPQDVKLPILSITYAEDPLAADGYQFWAEVLLQWTPLLPLPVTSGDVTGTIVGFEARCFFDGVFDESDAEAWEQVLSVFTAGLAMPVMIGNRLSVFVDRRRPPVALVTMANCLEDTFELSWTGSRGNPNSYDVDFLDELTNWENVTMQVDHASVQDEAVFDTFRKKRAKFVGVTRRSQAFRDAHFRLNQFQDLKRAVKFSLGLDGVPLLPGDRIRVAHDTPNYGTSGRLLGGSEIIGNYNAYPESFAANLVLLGGMLDVTHPTMEVAGVPSVTLPDPTYQMTGPFGYGSAELVRNVARGNGIDGSTDGALSNAGGVGSLEFYSSALGPGGEVVAAMGYIEDGDWELTVAGFVFEPAIAASDEILFGINFTNAADGTALNEFYGGRFQWGTGALTAVGTPTNGATVTVQAPGTTGADAGWYRVAVHMKFADIPGANAAGVGDPYEVTFSPANAGNAAAGNFVGAFDDGKGVNFLASGDPLDFSKWDFLTNATQTSVLVTPTPPFYSDQSHGAVQRVSSDIANGNNASGRQVVTIQGAGTTFGGAGAVTGEDFTTTFLVREGTATKTRLNVYNPTGNNVVVDVNWPAATLTTTGSAGFSATIAAVTQNSTTTDADWYEVSAVFNNAAGDTTYTVQFWPQFNSSGATGLYVDVWGIRTHGDSDNGTNVNPYPHRGSWLWGVDVHPSYAIADYTSGTEVALDRPFTFVAGESYELEVRSSSIQAEGGGPIRENVTIAPSEVPASGSTLVPAGQYIKTAESFRTFQAARGDIYSIGEVGTSVVDFSIVEIDMNPANLSRAVTAIEYKDSVYDLPSDLAGVEASALTFVSGDTPTRGRSGVPLDAFAGAPLEARDTTSRAAGGDVHFSVTADWSFRRGVAGNRVAGVRLYVATMRRMNSGSSGMPVFVKDAPSRHRSAIIENYPFIPGSVYRIYFQPYGPSGDSRPAAGCPWVTFTFWGGTPRPAAPVIDASVPRGERAILRIEAAELSDAFAPKTYEVRAGGWLLGQHVSNTTGGLGEVSDELYTGPVNAAGEGAPWLHVRGSMGGGLVSRHASARMTAGITGATVVNDTPFEDDWTDGGTHTLTGGVINADNCIEFENDTKSRADWTSGAKTLTHARRVYVEFWVEADAIPGQTMGDLDGVPLGHPRFYHWTLEGPTSGPEFANLHLQVKWDHSETETLSGEFSDFRPGLVFIRKAQFRIAVRRSIIDDFIPQVRIRRAGLRVIEVPSYRYDGGTF